MKTDPKTTNPIRALSHPEHLSTDNNKWKLYEVTVHRTEYYETKVKITAKSEQDAEAYAERIAARQEEPDWHLADRDLYAVNVEQVKKGSSNE